jgi:hypothetical protein
MKQVAAFMQVAAASRVGGRTAPVAACASMLERGIDEIFKIDPILIFFLSIFFLSFFFLFFIYFDCTIKFVF